MSIDLPISKSIANRILMLQAINGDELLPVSVDMPDDVRVLHDALNQLREYRRRPKADCRQPLVLNLKNCGTALRFLQVHLERCYPGEPITLTGDERLMERNGAPTSQTTSARILHGDVIPVSPDESPYITMSRRLSTTYRPDMGDNIERDWSSAAFWYEYVAIHGGKLLLNGLTSDSLQGDRIVADIYATHFGVTTTFVPEGALIQSTGHTAPTVKLDFTHCPDLYPAIAMTCERLGILLNASGTERLAHKESNRLEAVAAHETRHDHRMAMALLAAGFPVDDTECIAKSYPSFLRQWKNLTSAAGCAGIGSLRCMR